MQSSFLIAIFQVVALLVAITVHEFMHAWTENYLGDPTAKLSGRATLNPIAHLDLFGTVLLPLVLIIIGSPFVFGYAKPVPINPNNFKNRRLGEALTSLAGPFSNLLVALFFVLAYKFLPTKCPFTFLLVELIIINLVLALFNIIPIPPLDGSKVLFSVLPYSPALEKFEIYGPFILIPLILILGPIFISPALIAILNFLGVSLTAICF